MRWVCGFFAGFLSWLSWTNFLLFECPLHSDHTWSKMILSLYATLSFCGPFWFSSRGVTNFAILGRSSQCNKYKCIQMYCMPILNHLPSWLKKLRFAKLNGSLCHYFPMGRFAWVMVFAVICGAVALRPETSESLPAVLSGCVVLQECV